MTSMRKRVLLVLIAAFLLIPGICVLFQNTAKAGAQTFLVPNETKVTPVNLKN